jgi:hypothetical protein
MWRKLGLSTLAGLLTLTTVAAQPPYPRRVPPPIPPQERGYRQRDTRASWHYFGNGGGAFQRVRGRQWAEYRTLYQPVAFRETARTRDYVELYDDERDLYVRLYPDKAYVKLPGQDWAVAYDGRWE